MDRSIVETAASPVPEELRILDATHLARALSVTEDVTALLAHDGRLCSASREAGNKVISPT
jgi:hypothetical protein